MKATLSKTPTSYKKMNVIASAVRRQPVTRALDMLKMMPKKGANALYKAIASALANAETNDKQDRNNLIVDQIVVNKGLILKRNMPVSRGRAHMVRKQTCNVKVMLAAAAPAPVKAEKKAKPTTK